LSFRPAGEIFKGAGNIRTSQDSSLCSERQWGDIRKSSFPKNL